MVEKNEIKLPSIPVVMRYPYVISSVEQHRSEYHQQQLQKILVSESFIPMTPNATKLPRKRRRPPFSYSSLIAQAILESENERLTLREVYRWIVEKYPALYNADDTGWQNTIRHNLSLNKCFKKVPKSELDGSNKGKGGYWTIDPAHMAKFKNGAFVRGSSSTLRRTPPIKPSLNKESSPLSIDAQQQQSYSPTLSFKSSSALIPSNNYNNNENNNYNNHHYHHDINMPQSHPSSSPLLYSSTSSSSSATLLEESYQQQQQQSISSPKSSSSLSFKSSNCNKSPMPTSTVMKIQNILN
ncbi:fork head domain-containing protein [Cunninghamella echinulata]|nr:fork head domain-containing protein [Cunninghamella echinulata]